MKIEDFISKLKECKFTPTHTGFFHVKLITNKEHTKQKIYNIEECSKCKRTTERGLTVEFFKPVHLTIFEAEMLYAIFCLNKKPMDYASFHKCIHGKEFIENIKSIEV